MRGTISVTLSWPLIDAEQDEDRNAEVMKK